MIIRGNENFLSAREIRRKISNRKSHDFVETRSRGEFVSCVFCTTFTFSLAYSPAALRTTASTFTIQSIEGTLSSGLRSAMPLGTWPNRTPRAHIPTKAIIDLTQVASKSARTSVQPLTFLFARSINFRFPGGWLTQSTLLFTCAEADGFPRHRNVCYLLCTSPLDSLSLSLYSPSMQSVRAQPAKLPGLADLVAVRPLQAGARTRPLHVTRIGGGCRPKG